MKKWKQLIAAVLTLAMLVSLMPVESVKAAGKKPKALSAEDFVYTYASGSEYDFLESSKDRTCYNSKITGYAKTTRNVEVGSTEAFVKKQYGDTDTVPSGQKDKFYKLIKYGSYDCFDTDISAWKKYLEYTYQDESDNYAIRFYLNKKNKVTAIASIKNLDKYKEYPDEEVKPGLTFKAPKGKKVTTQKIGGKKVYMVPAGTKIKVKNPNMSTKLTVKSSRLTSNGGTRISYYSLFHGIALEAGKSYDLETLIAEGNDKQSDEDKLRPDDNCTFRLEFDGPRRWDAEKEVWHATGENLAPKYFYFKFI